LSCEFIWAAAVASFNVTEVVLHGEGPPQGGVLPYMGYIGMCGPKGYGVSAVLAINGVSI